MGKEALGVRRERLFRDGDFSGYRQIGSRTPNYMQMIDENAEFFPRGEKLEMDRSVKQAIPYIWIANPMTQEVLLYRREPNMNDTTFMEKRYLDKFSGGVGGHINRVDATGVVGFEQILRNAMGRELREELEIAVQYPVPEVVGFLNDESDSIGSVHFGIVAMAFTHYNVEAKAGEGLKEPKFHSLNESEEILSSPNNQVENWTKISWPYIRDLVRART